MKTSCVSACYALSFSAIARASVTVYDQIPLGESTNTKTADGPQASYTGAAAYDPTVLLPPPIPDPPLPTQLSLQLSSDAQNVQGLSITQSGSFYGFSIEMSVVGQVSE